MMGFCWRRFFLILFMFLVFFVSLFAFRNPAVYRFLFNRYFSSDQVSITEEMLLERLAVSFPDIIAQLSRLNPRQQKRLIEKVRRDIVAAASASGQNNEQAQKLGETVAMVLSKAVSHPSIADAYF